MRILSRIPVFLMVGIITFLPHIVYSAKTNPLKDYSTNVLKMQMKEKKMRMILNDTVDQISNDCCENNFEDKEKLLQIKTDLINCLNSEDKKCFKSFLVYIIKPEKLIVLEKVEESKKLLLKNKRLRYDNELLKQEQEEELALKKQQTSQDYGKLKEAYDLLDDNNNKLKKRIESMLESYDKRIIELEEANAKLKEEYSKVFEMLPKYQKKKLLKEAESQ